MEGGEEADTGVNDLGVVVGVGVEVEEGRGTAGTSNPTGVTRSLFLHDKNNILCEKSREKQSEAKKIKKEY